MIIAGLGNPGEEYAATRHNVGFMVVDAFVKKHGGAWKTESGLYSESNLRYASKNVSVIKPLTYMNESGRAIRKAMAVHGTKPQDVVVVVDEFNFPVGRVHLRSGGSDGGHNGVASVIKELGTPHFWRLRLGIDRDFGPGQLVDYVLSPFPSEKLDAVRSMLDTAVVTLEAIVRLGPAAART